MPKLLSKSYAGGVITPELYGRLDLIKRQTGLTTARNGWVLPYGPWQNRPGFEYVLNVKDSTKATRVYEFEPTDDQTYVIEFGDQYARFHTDGGTVVEAGVTITAVSQGNPGIISAAGHTFLDGEWVFLAGIVGMTELNGRFVVVRNPIAGVSFEIEDLFGTDIDTSGFTAYVSGGTASRVFEITTPYLEAELFQLKFTQDANVLTIVHVNHDVRELRRLTLSSFALTLSTFSPTLAAPAVPTLATGGPGGGTPITHEYVSTALNDVTLEESLPSPSASISHDLTVTGNFIDVTTQTVVGAIRQNVYKLKNGLFGFIGQTSDAGVLRDNNIDPDVSQTPPIDNTPFDAVDDKPGAVGYAEQRKIFGGTTNNPTRFFMTRSATESNLGYSIPGREDDSIQGDIKARKRNRILHIVPFSRVVFLTSGGAWLVAPENSDILTPDSVFPRIRSNDGSSEVRPLLPAFSAIYVHSSGDRIHELKHDQTADGLSSVDASVMAPHLFDGFIITDSAYAKAPHRICWFTRSDGQLLGMTYLPEHKVLAWHEHDTPAGGEFESLASVKESARDVLYAVVKRTINSQTVRYIERLQKRVPLISLADAFFVDSGLTFSGAATDTITGLHHLVGETVSILADGSEHPTRVVSAAGTITLDDDYEKVHVGLGYVSDMETLPLAIEMAEAGGQGTKKNLCEVYLRVYQSGGAGITAGPDADNLREFPPRTTEPYGTPPALQSAEIRIGIDAKWTNEGTLLVRQAKPLPLTVLSMTLGTEIGG